MNGSLPHFCPSLRPFPLQSPSKVCQEVPFFLGISGALGSATGPHGSSPGLRPSEMRKLHSVDNLDHIKDAWKLLDEHILDYVMNIMKTHAFVDHTKDINSVYALVPIIVFCFNKGKGH